jgi:hypothetical protein
MKLKLVEGKIKFLFDVKEKNFLMATDELCPSN